MRAHNVLHNCFVWSSLHICRINMYSVSSRNALMREQNRERPALTEGTHDILLRFPPSTRTKSREDPRKNEVFLWDCLIKCVPTSFFFLFRLHKKKKYTHTHTHNLCLGAPLVRERGAWRGACNAPKHDEVNPLVHAVTYITETQAGPLNCNMPICSAPENYEGKQSSGGWKKV